MHHPAHSMQSMRLQHAHRAQQQHACGQVAARCSHTRAKQQRAAAFHARAAETFRKRKNWPAEGKIAAEGFRDRTAEENSRAAQKIMRSSTLKIDISQSRNNSEK